MRRLHLLPDDTTRLQTTSGDWSIGAAGARCRVVYVIRHMHAIRTTALTHRFGAETALHALDLAVPDGSIYGFLGPNGAGKTTTLRLILGLLRRQHGTIEVLGRSLERDRLAILQRVGSSIESPSLYDHLTAHENLEVWRRIFCCPRERISAVLDVVGLSHTGTKRAERFSLGMKQRLAIAVALLHEPSLLILDEPINGLDPHGILEMRALLGALNREHGITILVSSHILSEVERVVTHVGVIYRGALRFQGTLDELRARGHSSAQTLFDTDDNAKALDVATRAGFTGQLDGNGLALPALTREDAAALNTRLVSSGIAVHEIVHRGKDLEGIFLDLAGEPS